jgi:hypothetical protein
MRVIENTEALTDRDFIINFQDALYHAARNPESQQILYGYDYQQVPREVGPAVLFAARARFELLVQEDPELAQGTLDFAFEQFGDAAVLQLAQAEIFIQAKEFEQAQTLLDDLKTGTAPWIRDQARALTSLIP